MRTAFLSIALICLLAACNNQKEEPQVVVKGKVLTPLKVSPEKVKGTYVGDFKGSPIAITLNYVGDNHVSGYNVHKGLTRNINGTIETTEKGVRLQLSEPGNNQYDGKFDLIIDTVRWTGKGLWKPFKKGEEASFSFKKQDLPTDENLFYSAYMDSLENYITFNTDGSCTYTYLSDTTVTGQQLTIKGNFTLDKKAVTIYWQKNDVFPQKTVLKIIRTKPFKDEDFTELSLKGEGRVFTQMIY